MVEWYLPEIFFISISNVEGTVIIDVDSVREFIKLHESICSFYDSDKQITWWLGPLGDWVPLVSYTFSFKIPSCILLLVTGDPCLVVMASFNWVNSKRKSNFWVLLIEKNDLQVANYFQFLAKNWRYGSLINPIRANDSFLYPLKMYIPRENI